MTDITTEAIALQHQIDCLLFRLNEMLVDPPSIWDGLAFTVASLLWVAAHHGLRRLGAARDPHDAAPYPLTAWHVRLWGYVHDLTAALGCPPAPGEWKVRR